MVLIQDEAARIRSRVVLIQDEAVRNLQEGGPDSGRGSTDTSQVVLIQDEAVQTRSEVVLIQDKLSKASQ